MLLSTATPIMICYKNMLEITKFPTLRIELFFSSFLFLAFLSITLIAMHGWKDSVHLHLRYVCDVPHGPGEVEAAGGGVVVGVALHLGAGGGGGHEGGSRER